MEEWLKSEAGNEHPNIRRVFQRYDDMIAWCNDKENKFDAWDGKVPHEYYALYDDTDLEFARALNHDLGHNAVHVAQLILLIHGQTSIDDFIIKRNYI
jgi:hypothetical protein